MPQMRATEKENKGTYMWLKAEGNYKARKLQIPRKYFTIIINNQEAFFIAISNQFISYTHQNLWYLVNVSNTKMKITTPKTQFP